MLLDQFIASFKRGPIELVSPGWKFRAHLPATVFCAVCILRSTKSRTAGPHAGSSAVTGACRFDIAPCRMRAIGRRSSRWFTAFPIRARLMVARRRIAKNTTGARDEKREAGIPSSDQRQITVPATQIASANDCRASRGGGGSGFEAPTSSNAKTKRLKIVESNTHGYLFDFQQGNYCGNVLATGNA